MDPFAPPPPPPGLGPPPGMLPPSPGGGGAPPGMASGPPPPGGPGGPPPPVPGLGNPASDIQALALKLVGASDSALPGILASLPRHALPMVKQLVASDPAVRQRFMRAALQLRSEQQEREPAYPLWYEPPLEPTWADIDSWASTDMGQWQSRNSRIRYELEIYEHKYVGQFEVDKDANKPQFKSTGLRDDADLAISLMGEMERVVQMIPRHQGIKEQTRKCENALRYLNREWNYRHAKGGHGTLNYDKGKSLILTGTVVARLLPDLDDPACPVRFDLMNPCECYPSFAGPRGMLRMVRVYTSTIAELIGDYGAANPDLHATLMSRPRTADKTKNGGAKPYASANRKASDERGSMARELWEKEEVIEYYDTWYRSVHLRDGAVIVPITAHELGYVPFVWQFSDLGRPRVIMDTATMVVETTDGERVSTNDDDPWRNVGASFIHARIPAHLHLEEQLSKLQSMFSRVDIPTWHLYRDPVAMGAEDDEPISNTPGDTVEFQMNHEEARDWIPKLDSGAYGPLFNAVAQDKATGQMPIAMYGAPASSQSTGAAQDGMAHQGMEKIAPLIAPMQLFEAQVMEMALLQIREFGDDILPPTDDAWAGMEVPYDKGAQMGHCFTLTADDVAEAGTRVEVFLENPSIRNLPMILNAGALALSSGQASLREVIGWRGVHDEQAVIDEINEEKAMMAPAVQQAIQLESLWERYVDPVTNRLSEKGMVIMSLVAGSGGPNGPTAGAGMGQGGGLGALGGGGAMAMGNQSPNTAALNQQAFNPMQGGGAGRPQGGGTALASPVQPVAPV